MIKLKPKKRRNRRLIFYFVIVVVVHLYPHCVNDHYIMMIIKKQICDRDYYHRFQSFHICFLIFYVINYLFFSLTDVIQSSSVTTSSLDRKFLLKTTTTTTKFSIIINIIIIVVVVFVVCSINLSLAILYIHSSIHHFNE